MRAPILTERLLLRDVVEADAELLLGLDAITEVMRFIGTSPPLEVAWHRNRIRNVYIPIQSHPWHGIRLVVDRTSGEFLGWVFIRPANAALHARDLGWTRPDEVELGFRLHPHAWGRGIATEAAAPLVRTALADPATTSVVACAHAENAASLRVLEKVGLQRVGEVLLPGAGAPTVKLGRGNGLLFTIPIDRKCT